MVFSGNGCAHCAKPAPAPVARDIGALTWAGGTQHALQRRMDRLAQRNTKPVEPRTPRAAYKQRGASIAREASVLSHLAAGTTNLYEIGRALNLTGQGVRHIVLRICERYGVTYKH